jgi:hypothetical protein
VREGERERVVCFFGLFFLLRLFFLQNNKNTEHRERHTGGGSTETRMHREEEAEWRKRKEGDRRKMNAGKLRMERWKGGQEGVGWDGWNGWMGGMDGWVDENTVNEMEGMEWDGFWSAAHTRELRRAAGRRARAGIKKHRTGGGDHARTNRESLRKGKEKRERQGRLFAMKQRKKRGEKRNGDRL